MKRNKSQTCVIGNLAAVLVAALTLAAPHAAAQMGPPTYSWGGAYVGGNLGYQWGTTTNNGTEPSGFAGGLQAGYNWQNGQFVYGAETDLQISGADDVFAAWKFSNPWFGTLRGRGGVALNNVLLYGTIGLAYGGLKAQSTLTGVDQSKVHGGWTVGAGMEVALTGNWTARAEYLYVDLGNRVYSLTGTSNGLESSVLRFGVNYRF